VTANNADEGHPASSEAELEAARKRIAELERKARQQQQDLESLQRA
jgi:hypothetical protein